MKQLCMWVLMGACSLASFAEEAKPKVEMRIYDVRDLTEVALDHPAPPVMLRETTQTPQNQNNTPATLATVADMVRNRISPDTWDGALGTSIEERSGLLIVMQTPDIHQQIQKMLSWLRQYSKAHVVVRAKLVTSATVPAATFHTPEALAELLDPKQGCQVVGAPRLIGSNNQLLHVISGRTFTFVGDLDVSGQMMDPVMRTALEGYVLEVRPGLSSDRTNISMDLKFQLGAQADRSVTRGATYASPINLAAGNEKVPMNNELSTPSMGTAQVSTQVVLPAGKWMLAAVMKNPNRDARNKHLLLFVTAEAAEKHTTGKPMTLGMFIPPVPAPVPPAIPAAAAPAPAAAENF